MWVFLSSRIRTWLLLAVAVPIVRWLIRRVRLIVSRRRSDGVVASTLTKADSALAHFDRRQRRRDRKARRRAS